MKKLNAISYKINYVSDLEHSESWRILLITSFVQKLWQFYRTGKIGCSTRRQFLYCQTSLLCIMVELAGEGSANNWATPSSSKPWRIKIALLAQQLRRFCRTGVSDQRGSQSSFDVYSIIRTLWEVECSPICRIFIFSLELEDMAR